MSGDRDEDERCFICLVSDGEPMLYGKPGTVEKLISPCHCSLRAHESCLIDWVMNTGRSSIREATPIGTDPTTTQNGWFASGVGIGIGRYNLGLNHSRKLYSSPNVKCPQCGYEITLLMKPSTLLSLDSFIRNNVSRLGRDLALTSAGTVVGLGVIASLASVFIGSGFKLLNSIAPDSVILNLLSVKGYYRSFNSALQDNAINLSQFKILGGFPLYLYSVRSSESFVAILFSCLYSTCFIPLSYDLNEIRGPKLFLLCFEALRTLYGNFFTFTFNRLYYRWVTKFHIFHSEEITKIEDFEQAEQEHLELETLETTRLTDEYFNNKNWTILQRVYRWFFPKLSIKEKNLRAKQRLTELRMILKHDFSKAFFKDTGSKIISTILWPYVGSLIGKLFIRLSFLNRFVNLFSNTPDESKFYLNCFGCCFAVLLKDLVNLFIAYRQVQRFKNIKVYHTGIDGFQDSQGFNTTERQKATELLAAAVSQGDRENIITTANHYMRVYGLNPRVPVDQIIDELMN